MPIDDETLERRGEVAALWLLLIGGIVLPVVGWVIGVVILRASEGWTRRDKLIGTLVVPGGLLFPLAVLAYYSLGAGWGLCDGPVFRTLPDGTEQLLRSAQCVYEMTGKEAAAIVLPLIVAPIASFVYLARRRGSALVGKA